MNEFIIDKFLSDEAENDILSLTTDSNFTWFFSSGTVLPEDLKDNPFIIPIGLNPFQFIHRIDIQNCSYSGLLAPILNTIATEFETNIQIIRMKFNMLTKYNSQQHHYPHTDVDETDDCYTAIYYVNDSDGDTYLFEEFVPKEKDEVVVKSTIPPKKGKLVIFRADRFHASSSPMESNYRIVLNVVFRIVK